MKTTSLTKMNKSLSCNLRIQGTNFCTYILSSTWVNVQLQFGGYRKHQNLNKDVHCNISPTYWQLLLLSKTYWLDVHLCFDCAVVSHYIYIIVILKF